MTKTVLVGLSGGVDSTVAAILLKEKGYNVIGATMAIWGNREIKGMALKSGHKDACFSPNEKEDIDAARKIAEEIGIDYHVFDCTQQYEEIVLKYFKNEYLKGRTPNPCIWCNALVKFGALPYVARLNGLEFDYFATGHYARVEKGENRYLLKRGIMPKKDQSYFLYKLTQDQLKEIMLPLGGYKKEEIRELARKYGLTVADKPDSQDFYDGDYNDLLGIQDKIGNIVDLEGNVLGQHKGIWNYTVGQRKGLGISSTEPLYVLSLNKDKNEVVVGPLDKTFKKSLIAKNINLVSFEKIEDSFKAKAKIRSTQEPQDVTVEKIDDDTVKITFDEYQKSIAIGQSAVVYIDDILVLGGVIDSVE